MTKCQLVTGGAGFIGSNYIRAALAATSDEVVVVDKLTYAGNLATLGDVLNDPRVVFYEADIADTGSMAEVFRTHRPRAVLNFAAESHVDRSIDGPRNFLHSNTVGVFELLEAAREFFAGLPAEEKGSFRFLQVSTDEVFGSLGEAGVFTEASPYSPRSPYAATKAGADHLVRAYHETYGLPTLITHSSNNYGPYQFPEKLIPLMTLNALAGKPLPVYGSGGNVRDWLHVHDHCEALLAVLERGKPGSTYAVGARNERTNLEVVHAVCAFVEDHLPAEENPHLRAALAVADGSPAPEAPGGRRGYRQLVTFVEDRPGHDFRYAIDPTRIEAEIGWSAKRSYREGLRKTVEWYVENQGWCAEVQAGAYDGERLGLDR